MNHREFEKWLRDRMNLRTVSIRDRLLDYATPDHREIYEIKWSAQGVRDLLGALMELASAISRSEKVERAFLLIGVRRISAERVESEIEQAFSALREAITRRLYVAAVVDGTSTVVHPAHWPTERQVICQRFLESARDMPGRKKTVDEMSKWPYATSWKHLEVEKILLHRWLLRQGRISLGALATQVGCSYPTVRHALNRLEVKGLIEGGRNRAVELKKYGRSNWAELFTSMKAIYPSQEFVDVSGHAEAVARLLSRLRKRRPGHVAIGGVVAARHWDPNLDLHGIPRIDIVLQAAADASGAHLPDDVELVHRIDPGLKRRQDAGRGSAVLVVHRVYRKHALFDHDPAEPLDWADPVETVYHLHLQGLRTQAAGLLAHLRPEGRLE